jgi:hypothetical protein
MTMAMATGAQDTKVTGLFATVASVGQVVDVEALGAAAVFTASFCPSERLPSLPLPG